MSNNNGDLGYHGSDRAIYTYIVSVQMPHGGEIFDSNVKPIVKGALPLSVIDIVSKRNATRGENGELEVLCSRQLSTLDIRALNHYFRQLSTEYFSLSLSKKK